MLACAEADTDAPAVGCAMLRNALGSDDVDFDSSCGWLGGGGALDGRDGIPMVVSPSSTVLRACAAPLPFFSVAVVPLLVAVLIAVDPDDNSAVVDCDFLI